MSVEESEELANLSLFFLCVLFFTGHTCLWQRFKQDSPHGNTSTATTTKNNHESYF